MDLSIDKRIDDRLKKSEIFLLDEIERNRNEVESHFDRLEKKMDQMNCQIGTLQAGMDNANRVLAMIPNLQKSVEDQKMEMEDHRKRIERLEQKTA